MAPHNTMYSNLPDHLNAANIKYEVPSSKNSDWFNRAINNFRTPLILGKESGGKDVSPTGVNSSR